MPKKYKYYYESSVDIAEVEQNWGIKNAVELLRKLQQGNKDIDLVDTATWNTDQRNEVYYQTITLAVTRHIKTRRIFGSARRSGVYFGSEVPALFVLDDDDKIQDVYPHEKDGTVITIWDYLQSLET
ncbi:MAG: hypothetical protein GF411_03410 [Candidatus Lokiarchaeota archaeon]|nr:hypothetical protein [Candidatus Lokiarchaeota archaeon]